MASSLSLRRKVAVPAIALLLSAGSAGAQDRMVGAWALNRYAPGMCSVKTTASGGAAIVGMVQYRDEPFSFQLSFKADAGPLNAGIYGLSLDGGAPVAPAKLTEPGFGSAFNPPLPVGQEMKAWIELPQAELAALRSARTITIVRTDKKGAPIVSIAAPAIGQGLDGLAQCMAEGDESRPAAPPTPPMPQVPTVPFSLLMKVGEWNIDPSKNCLISTGLKGYPYDPSARVLGSLGLPDMTVEVRKFGTMKYQITLGGMPRPRQAKPPSTDWSFKLGATEVKAPLVPIGYAQVGPVGVFDDLPSLLAGKRKLVVRYRSGAQDVDHVSVDLEHLDLALKTHALCRAI